MTHRISFLFVILALSLLTSTGNASPEMQQGAAMTIIYSSAGSCAPRPG
jgi:hypothetical protein